MESQTTSFVVHLLSDELKYFNLKLNLLPCKRIEKPVCQSRFKRSESHDHSFQSLLVNGRNDA